MKKAFLFFVTCLFIAGPALAAEVKFSKEFQKCLDQLSGGELIECAFKEFEKQDSRLNAAYKELMAWESEEQKKKLREAQRAWIKFRDAWSEYLLDPNQGTMIRIRSMRWRIEATMDQASRLEGNM